MSRAQAGHMDLARHVEDWRPPDTDHADVIAARRVRELAATLDIDESFADGDALPALWHWLFFLDWPKGSELGADGHPRDGVFLPRIPNRRRMFAGARLTIAAPLVIGEAATRHAQVMKTSVKHGRSGDLLFVTVRSQYRQRDREVLVEEQDSSIAATTVPPRRSPRHRNRWARKRHHGCHIHMSILPCSFGSAR